MSIRFSASYQDRGGVSRLRAAADNALEEISTIIADDSNKFIPFDQGPLEQSVYSSSNFADGQVIWDTVYAARLYYGTGFHFQTLHNSLAQAMWFEAAKRMFIANWIRYAEEAIERNL